MNKVYGTTTIQEMLDNLKAGRSKLIEDDKGNVSALKQMHPSMQLVTIKDKLNLQRSNNVQSVSKATLSCTLRLSLTYKKIGKVRLFN